MDPTATLNVILGFILGYATWNIVDILRANKKLKELKHKSEHIQKLTQDIKNKLGITDETVHESNPLKAAYLSLTERLDMPKEKVILSKDDNALTIAYGHSCVIALDKPEDGTICIAIGVDKTTTQSQEARQEELEELTKLIFNAGFEHGNFSRALAFMTVAVAKHDKEKYSDVTRQIPHDML